MRLRYGDFIIIACVALLAAGSFLLGLGSKLNGGEAVAEVWQGGKLVKSIKIGGMTDAVEINLDGLYHNKVVAEYGRIRFAEADCPDKVCVHTGWITRAGQTAACVPNRAVVKIVGGTADEDVVIR